MKCPVCRKDHDRVIDSRVSADGFAIRRRRECLNCDHRFTTYEKVEEPSLMVIKKDGGRVPFDAEKLRSGVVKACWKRPISSEQIDALVASVEYQAFKEYEGEAPSSALGEMVMNQLSKLDRVAFVRFASVYRRFEDASDFVKELGPFLSDQ